MKKRLLIMMAIVMAVTPAAPLMAQEAAPAEEAPIDEEPAEEEAPIEDAAEDEGTEAVDGDAIPVEEDAQEPIEDLEEETALEDAGDLAAVKNGWVKEKGGTTYYVDGKRVQAESFMEIGGDLYYFDGDGYLMPNGGIWIDVDYAEEDDYGYSMDEKGRVIRGISAYEGETTAHDEKTGKSLSGWAAVGGKGAFYNDYSNPLSGFSKKSDGVYYLPGGKAKPGLVTLDYKYRDSEGDVFNNACTYYFDRNGKMLTGWQKISGSTYFFKKNGAMMQDRTNVLIGGRYYAFDEKGRMFTGIYYEGEDDLTVTDREDDGLYAWFYGRDGKLVEYPGFYNVSNLAWMNSPSDTSSTSFDVIYVDEYGSLQTGLKTIGGKTYYFSPRTGIMARRFWHTIKGKTYYFGRYGEMATSWQTINSYRYYFGPDGAQRTGWHTIGGKTYYFFPKTSGISYKGTVAEEWQTINGCRYYFGTDGAQRTGFQKIGGKTYYFFPKTSGKNYKGTMAKNWATINNKTYYFGTNGIMRTGWQDLNGFRYCFGPDGAQRLGLQKIGGKLYYFWPRTEGKHYKGTMAKSATVTVSGKKYAIGKDGTAVRR